MLRNMTFLGAAIAVMVAFPIVYESRKDVIHEALAPSPPHERQAGSDGSSTTTLALSPASRRQPESLAGRIVRLPSDRQGQFNGEFRFNGVRLEALVDTGATVVAINRSTARRIGIPLSPSDFRHEVNTANGRTRAAAVVIDRLEIGRIHLDEIEAVVLEDDALGVILIGMNFLNQLRRFGVESGTLILEQ
ncbi:MAG: retropepsin-like aspartic protease family protein [Rhizobiaceae bacterium]